MAIKIKYISFVIAGITIYFLFFTTSPSPSPYIQKKEESIPIILLPPIKPDTPIVKPEPPPPKEEEMIEQPPVDKVEEPDETPSEIDNDLLGTDNIGNGPDMGLKRGSGNSPRSMIGTSGKGNKWNRFAVDVQSSITRILNSSDPIRKKGYDIKLRLWVDSNGVITRCLLSGSSGDTTIDDIIKRSVLSNSDLSTPPVDMPMPINIRIRSSMKK